MAKSEDYVNSKQYKAMHKQMAGNVLYDQRMIKRAAPVDITKDYGYEEADPDTFAKAHMEGKVKVLNPERNK